MEKVQIIPPPKDVDPRVLAWKGAAVLGKMDSVSDLWITALDWVGALLHMVEHNSHSHGFHRTSLVCVDSKNGASIYSVRYFLDNFQPVVMPNELHSYER